MTPSRIFGHVMAAVVALIVFLLGVGIIGTLLIGISWVLRAVWRYFYG